MRDRVECSCDHLDELIGLRYGNIVLSRPKLALQKLQVIYYIRVHWYPWHDSKKSLCCCMPAYELSCIFVRLFWHPQALNILIATHLLCVNACRIK
jgi:hypothetical protein